MSCFSNHCAINPAQLGSGCDWPPDTLVLLEVAWFDRRERATVSRQAWSDFHSARVQTEQEGNKAFRSKCEPGMGMGWGWLFANRVRMANLSFLFHHLSWALTLTPTTGGPRQALQSSSLSVNWHKFGPIQIRRLCGGATFVAKHKSLKTNPSAQSGAFCLVIGCLSRNTRDNESQRPVSVQLGA